MKVTSLIGVAQKYKQLVPNRSTSHQVNGDINSSIMPRVRDTNTHLAIWTNAPINADRFCNTFF